MEPPQPAKCGKERAHERERNEAGDLLDAGWKQAVCTISATCACQPTSPLPLLVYAQSE